MTLGGGANNTLLIINVSIDRSPGHCFGWNKHPLLFNRFFFHYFQILSCSFCRKLPGVSHIKDVLFCQLAVVLAVP